MTSVFWKISGVCGCDSARQVGRNTFLSRSSLCKYCPELYWSYCTTDEIAYSGLESLVPVDLNLSLSLRSIHPPFEDSD